MLKEIFLVILQVVSVLAGFGAAYFWYEVSRVDMPKSNVGMDYNATAFHVEQIRVASAKQGRLNKFAAVFALVAAGATALASALDSKAFLFFFGV